MNYVCNYINYVCNYINLDERAKWAHTNMGNVTGRNGDVAFFEGMNRNIPVCDIF